MLKVTSYCYNRPPSETKAEVVCQCCSVTTHVKKKVGVDWQQANTTDDSTMTDDWANEG